MWTCLVGSVCATLKPVFLLPVDCISVIVSDWFWANIWPEEMGSHFGRAFPTLLYEMERNLMPKTLILCVCLPVPREIWYDHWTFYLLKNHRVSDSLNECLLPAVSGQNARPCPQMPAPNPSTANDASLNMSGRIRKQAHHINLRLWAGSSYVLVSLDPGCHTPISTSPAMGNLSGQPADNDAL